MQAVILAAGRGARMGDLTESVPKPMLKVLDKPILQYQLDNLPDAVDEVILVVNYYGSVIHDFFGGIYRDKKILYAEQDSLNGTAGALWAVKELLHDKFLVMNGDDIYAAEDMEKCLAFEWAALGMKVEELGSAGKIVLDEKGNVTDILEKEKHSGGPGYANTNFFLLDRRIFDYDMVKRPDSEEFGLPQTVVQAAKNIPIHMVEASSLLRFTSPEDIAHAEEVLYRATES